MSEDERKPGLLRRLFGLGTAKPKPAARPTPAKKDSSKPVKKEARGRTPKPKGPPPAGPYAARGEAPPEERAPSRRKKAPPAKEAPTPSARAKRKDSKPPKASKAPAAPPPHAPHTERGAAAKTEAAAQENEPRRGLLAQLRQGLARSSTALGDNLTAVLTKRKLDATTLDALEDVLIKADLGPPMAERVRAGLAAGRQPQGLTPEGVRAVLAEEIAKVLIPVAQPLVLEASARPHVILVVGVNGTGKTTTAAKLAHRFMAEDKSVLLAAADTFRAAAIDQLKIWGGRVGVPVVAKEAGADPAGVAYEALERARHEKRDVLLIDTAGRLQNKADLMAELAKIVRVLKKLDPSAPHSVVLVLDATTGQNALQQVEVFQEIAGVTGIVVTKLDGTARGGILVAVAKRFKLPIIAIGVGEGLDDLAPFDAQAFARTIAGLPSEHEAAA
jgi:fused signal recognition particle receptor